MLTADCKGLIRLRDLRDMLPPLHTGKRINYSTLWRWMTHGLSGVRLEVVFIGSVPWTTHVALERFFRAAAQARLKPNPPVYLKPGYLRKASKRQKAGV